MTAVGPQSQIKGIVCRSKSSFYWAMRLLPRPQREAMFALYAYCRELDDIADEGGVDKLERLAAWRDEIAALYAGQPRHVISRALAGPIDRFGLDRTEFEELIAGMEMDVRGEMIAPDWPGLRLYCRRVAGAVGMLAVHIFGCRDAPARRFAESLGEALQLTNILRDLAEDARLGRLYLPREALDQAGIPVRDPHAVLAHPALPAACGAIASRAEEKFAEAEGLLRQCNRSRLRPALIMMGTYRRLLARLCRGGWTHPERRPRLGGLEMLWIALRTL